jgi:hypothetical protein
MKTRTGITLVLLIVMVLAGCEKAGKTFEISGSPDPLLYGYCNEPTVTFTVSGPGEGLRIDGVIVAYNLFNGDGMKVKSGSLSLTLSPFHPAVTYIGSVTFKISSRPGAAVLPEDAIMEFGEGKVEFAATVSAYDLSPTGGVTYFLTSTKSVRVIPCGPTPPPPGGGPKPTPTPVPSLTPTPVDTLTPTPVASPTPPPNVTPVINPTKECNPLKQRCP